LLSTGEWTDGLVSTIVRHCCQQEVDDHQWVMFDGPVDALWIENMNTVLDDNKMLCLANSERIKLTPYVAQAVCPMLYLAYSGVHQAHTALVLGVPTSRVSLPLIHPCVTRSDVSMFTIIGECVHTAICVCLFLVTFEASLMMKSTLLQPQTFHLFCISFVSVYSSLPLKLVS
jgi:hypothetical protein